VKFESAASIARRRAASQFDRPASRGTVFAEVFSPGWRNEEWRAARTGIGRKEKKSNVIGE
jgi:hypothetical protein